MGQYDLFRQEAAKFLEKQRRIERLEAIAELLQDRSDLAQIDPKLPELVQSVKSAS